MRHLLLIWLITTSSLAQAKPLTDYVDPFIGTSNFGATHPGSQAPHAMLSISPFNVAFEYQKLNQVEKDQTWNSRVYVKENKFLTGFSHVNLSGVGCPDLGSLLLMPTTGKLELDPKIYGSTYKNEKASPGYYRTDLDKYKVRAEVTSGLRTGINRYTFPKGQSHILLNLGLGLTNETGAMLKLVSDREVEGFKMLGTFCYRPEDVRPVYFVMRLNKTPNTFGAFKKMPAYQGVEKEWVGYNDTYKPYANFRQELAGDNIGAWFSFDTQENEQIQIEVGISYVSIENARQNLQQETYSDDFDKLHAQTLAQWQALLSHIQVEGQEQDKTLFYSALYHVLIHPNIIQDANGDYPLMGRYGVGNNKKRNRYSTYSLWDTHRNLHPFLSLVYPELQSDMVNSMVEMGKESGWLPKWELLAMETSVMVGDPATPMIADTYLRGIRNFDINSAYQFALKAATQDKENPLRPENALYRKLGYVPVDGEDTWGGSVSTSLEYYIADWSLGQLAKALNKPEDYQQLNQQSMGYVHLFDPQTGMLRPKHDSGKWLSPYDPELGRNFEPAPGYVEGNAWNYRFYVPHDIPGLIQLLGGEQRFSQLLQDTFTTDNYDMANEPDITYPFLFNYVKGQEWRTQKQVSELIRQHYHTGAGGIPGNDDAGTLSAWLLYSMMGFYPVTPASMEYTLFTPTFDKVTINLNPDYFPGKQWTILRQPKDVGPYIESMTLNNTPLDRYFIHHQQITQGGQLVYRTHSQPSAR